MKQTGEAVEVAVEYRLGEYKRVLRDFIPLALERDGKKTNRLFPWNWPILEDTMFNLFVPLVFWFKKSRIGNCKFTFSEAGFTRTSRGRTASRNWDEVKVVHRLSGAYLIELKAGGALPVPYRAFTPEEEQLFEGFTQRAG